MGRFPAFPTPRICVLASAALAAMSSAGMATNRFVAHNGADGNPCTLAQPCRNIQRAIDVANPNDEVHVLSSAGYGNSLSITKSISVIAEGVDAIIVPGGITINNASAVVTLQGLHLSGAGTGLNGITISDAAAVHIVNCTVERFLVTGILLDFANAELFVSDTVSRDNGLDGLAVNGNGTTAKVSIDSSLFLSNGGDGLDIDGINSTISGVVASGNGGDGIEMNGGRMVVTDTIAANNGTHGFNLSVSAQMTLESVVARGNTSAGVTVPSGSTAIISRSVFTNNGTGVQNGGGTVHTRQNNLVRGNTTQTTGALTPLGGT